MKNVTLSIPDDLLEKSRKYAAEHGTSLNEFIRSLLRKHINSGESTPTTRIMQSMKDHKFAGSDWKWNRDELYDR